MSSAWSIWTELEIINATDERANEPTVRKHPTLFFLDSGSKSKQEAPFVMPPTASASLLATVNLIEYKINRSEQGAGNKTTRSAIMKRIFYELYMLVYIRSNETVIKVETDDRLR